ncbi:cadmium resistance transporter [Anabaena azotica]|uniref:Cadmium resistance transporter n=1 Tax=Anabaena azotica FACHB-119 TaxID=947527 RepID=A0ABR8D3S4_9NOST|nr:cadmium resistance transporter [Anabaena azotica]MBD2500408.1 cadmium resistance transporter [Anabaena azotica FACHB-119]
MNELFTAFSTGIVAFIATNIDDILILLLFFSQVNANFRPWQIVAGQYLGFTALILLSLPGFFGGIILPPRWIGLLGLLPIIIGISTLVNREVTTEELQPDITTSKPATFAELLTPQAYGVAAITVANGSDNVSVYLPLFANSNVISFFVIINSFFILLGIWCYVAYKLTYQRTIANILTRYGSQIIPFILIGLGTYIILKSQALSLIKLMGTYLCLAVFLKKSEFSNEVEEKSNK